MIFNWNQYPQTGGVTGQPTVDPSQLQVQSPMAPSNTSTSQGAPPGVDGAPVPPTASQQAGQTNATQGTPVGSQPWDQNYFSTTFGTPRTPQELVALESKITAAGGKVLRNASGVAGKIQTPDGRIIDVINSAGAGGNGFQWLDGGGGSGGGQFGGGNLSSLGYNFGDAMKPFVAPSAADAINSPEGMFALTEANRMMENGAASHGTLLNGRVEQAIAGSNVGNLLNRYGDIYNRSYQTFTRNQDAPFDKNLSLAKLGAPA